LPEERPPELEVLGWADVDPNHLAFASALDGGRDQYTTPDKLGQLTLLALDPGSHDAAFDFLNPLF
jgi:hypothetical protein